MEGADFNWKKSRVQQRRKDKRKKEFSHRNKNGQAQQDQETTLSDKTEENTDVKTSETEVPKGKGEVKKGLNEKDMPSKEGKEEKPVVDFSNLKRETEEIEKLVKKNQYEISSNWERYAGSENKEDIVYKSEEPADILKLLQSPNSYGGHFLLKEEQDWAATSKMLLSGCFALDLKRLAQGLSCIPFYIRHDLPENIFSEEEMEQMTCGLTKRRGDYFRSVKEETVTDKNRNVSEYTCNENILQISREDSDKTNIKQSELQCLDDCIIRNDKKNENIVNMENDYNSDDNIIQKNNAFSLENCVVSVEASYKTEQSPVKEEISFIDRSKRKHTVEVAASSSKHHVETKLENERNPLPVLVVASETFDSHISAIRESRTPEKTVDSFQKTFDSGRSSVKERSDSSEPVFSSNITDSKKISNRGESDIQSLKENEDRTTPSKPVSSSSTTGNSREDSTLQKTVADDLDFLLSLQDPVKKQPSVSVCQASGTSYVPAPKVTTAANKVEKDESLEDWLDSVLNG